MRRVYADGHPLARIDGLDERVDIDVAILDSGVGPHIDLRVAGGYDCTGGGRIADTYGHGTHVAGTVGALDNGIGVVGMAPGARLWSVKVLGDDGLGWLSWAACGVEWVLGRRDAVDPARPRIEIANMSVSWLGDSADEGDCGLADGDVLHQAICRSVDDGTTYVVAAGNQSTDAATRRPGAYDEVITVSALADFDGAPGGLGDQSAICPWYSPDVDDTYGDFSNFGADVDLIAPGKCILSTYPGGVYAWMTGTSMATPTVAGAVALYLSEHPGTRPGLVRQALQWAASPDWKRWTDPDGQPDRLLDLRALGPVPDYTLRLDRPAIRVTPGGAAILELSADRMYGHTAPVSLALDSLPTGLTAEVGPSLLQADPVTLTVRAAGDATPGVHSITVRGTDRDLDRSAPLQVTVSEPLATLDVVNPDEGTTTMASATDVAVEWSATLPEGWAPVDVRRFRAGIVAPGSCSGGRWVVDGELRPAAASPLVEILPDAACYRWAFRTTDPEGLASEWLSGELLVDTTAPDPAVVRASGAGAAHPDVNGPVYVRGGVSGTVALRAQGRDVQSDVRSDSFDEPVGAGWTTSVAAPADDPTTVQLAWTPDVVDGSIAVRSTNGVGITNDPRVISLLRDDTPPTGTRWDGPLAGSSGFSRDSLTLSWSGALDDRSGVAAQQPVQRQRAPVPANGDCAGGSYVDDGALRRLTSGAVESSLAHGFCYRWKLTPLDRVGNRGAALLSGTVLVDLEPPLADFGMPDEVATVLQATTSVSVSWSETDPGASGVTTRSLVRQRAAIVTPGTCAGSTWEDVNTMAVSGSPVAVTLRDAYCFRWVLTLGDAAGNLSSKTSGRILVDRTAPSLPSLSSEGAGTWRDPTGPIWVASDAPGSVLVRLASRDPQSGVASMAVSELAGTGWTRSVAPAGGTADVTLGWTAGASDASFGAAATNGTGLTSETRTVVLRTDASAPQIAFLDLPSGSTDAPAAVDWSEADAGVGIDPASRRLVRQIASPDAAGACTQVEWADEITTLGTAPPIAQADMSAGACYRWRLTVADRVGHIAQVVSSAVRLDADPPTVAVLAPAPGTTTIQPSGSVTVDWTASDAGDGSLLPPMVQRQRAPIAEPGVCTETWSDDGGAILLDDATARSLGVTGLTGGACYRWLVTVHDTAGNAATAASGTMLVDLTPPELESVLLDGDAGIWSDKNGIAWFHPDGTGTSTLTVTVRDAESGVSAASMIAEATGWTVTSDGLSGARLTARLDRVVDATTLDVRVAATNLAGLTGERHALRLRPDGTPPVVTFDPATSPAAVSGPISMAWTEQDAGAGIASRSVVHQWADAVDGTCAGVAWSEAGQPTSAPPPVTVDAPQTGCHRWRVTLADHLGNASEQVSGSVLVDADAPVVAPPALDLVTGGLLRLDRSLDATVSTRATDAFSGVGSVEWQRRDGTAAWVPVTFEEVLGGPAPSTLGTWTTYAAAATDRAGNRSHWAASPSTRAGAVDSASSRLVWTGTWSTVGSSGAWAGSERATTGADAIVRHAFTGRSVAWVARTGPGQGRASVMVDGVELATVDLGGATTRRRRLVAVAQWPTDGSHTIEIRALGSGMVTVDAFVVLRTKPYTDVLPS